MPSDEAVVKMTGEDADAMAMWRRQFSAVDRLDRKLEQLGAQGARMGQQMTSSLENVLGRWISIGAAIGTAATGVQRFFSDENTRRQQAGAAQRTYGVAFQELAGTVQATRPAELQALDTRVQRQAARTGVKPEEVAGEFTAAASAAGDLPPDQALRTAEVAQQLRPTIKSEDRQALTAASLEYQKRFPELDPEKALSRVLEAQAPALVKGVGDFSRNIAPAIAQLRQFGGKERKDNLEFLTSFVLGIGQSAGDTEGARTRTAAITFAQQMKEKTAPHLGTEATVEEQLAFVQSDQPEAKAIRQDLLGPLARDAADLTKKSAEEPHLRGEAQTKVALMELFDATSRTMDQVRNIRQGLAPTHEAAVAKIQANKAAMRELPSQGPIDLATQLEGKTKAMELGDVKAGETGTLRDQVGKSLAASGADFFERGMAFVRSELWGTLGGQTWRFKAEEESLRLRARGLQGPGASEESRRKAAILTEQADVLRRERGRRELEEAEASRRTQRAGKPTMEQEMTRTTAAGYALGMEPEAARRAIEERVANSGQPLHAEDAKRLEEHPEQAPLVLADLITDRRGQREHERRARQQELLRIRMLQNRVLRNEELGQRPILWGEAARQYQQGEAARRELKQLEETPELELYDRITQAAMLPPEHAKHPQFQQEARAAEGELARRGIPEREQANRRQALRSGADAQRRQGLNRAAAGIALGPLALQADGVSELLPEPAKSRLQEAIGAIPPPAPAGTRWGEMEQPPRREPTLPPPREEQTAPSSDRQSRSDLQAPSSDRTSRSDPQFQETLRQLSAAMQGLQGLPMAIAQAITGVRAEQRVVIERGPGLPTVSARPAADRYNLS